jgi:hypothetical protein
MRDQSVALITQNILDQNTVLPYLWSGISARHHRLAHHRQRQIAANTAMEDVNAAASSSAKITSTSAPQPMPFSDQNSEKSSLLLDAVRTNNFSI